ncbi:zinc finger SWIM domain-containing protein 7 isoform X1 [Strigops habroptila]|uniref:zinc finger SWIM domain-containing protein 7 isoform X1 n=1 Tax=Strigops habroptila TaxID=2489341 RepID=UPI0011D0309D|nr:zinc finger SWIM domain-containing protein 7 isoform X1 [Strigops habroptila]
MDSTLPAVAEELLKEIKKAFKETSHVPDDLLLGLKFIFGSCAVPALDLVDQRSVTRVTSPSGRTAYQVLGSSGKLYTCYSSCHYCTCPAFGFTVLQKSESLLIPVLRYPHGRTDQGQLEHQPVPGLDVPRDNHVPRRVQTYTCCLPQSGHGSLPGTNCV